MVWKVNGVEPIETSYVNGKIVGVDIIINGQTLRVCYYYDLTNNNAPFPPPPPLNFTYTDCFGNSQNVNVNPGPPTTVCALVDSVNVPAGGSASKGSRCSS